MKHFPEPWFRVVTTLSHNPLALVGGVLLCLSSVAAACAERELRRRAERDIAEHGRGRGVRHHRPTIGVEPLRMASCR